MAPSPKKKKAVSVTYIPDRSKAVDMGKRITLKKRRTTIRPITFDITVDENDSSTPVSTDTVHSVPDSQPEFPINDKSQPSVTNVRMTRRKAEANSPLVHSKDQAEGKKHKNQTQATPEDQPSVVNAGHQSSMVNVGHQSSVVNVGHQSAVVNVVHQPVASSLVKAGHQSPTGRSTRHQSRATKAGHKSATLQAEHQFQPIEAGNHQSQPIEAGNHQSIPIEAGSQSLGHQLSVHRTAEDRSSTIEAVSRSPTSSTGYQSRPVETVNQSVKHKTAELDSVPGNREGDQSPASNSTFKTSRNILTRAQQQTSASNAAQAVRAGLQPSSGKENAVDRGTADVDGSELPVLPSHHLRSSRIPGETKVLSTIKSALRRAKKGMCNVTADHVTADHVTVDHVTVDHVTVDHVTGDPVKSSALQVIRPSSDKPESGSKVATTHVQQNSRLSKDKTAATTSLIPSDGGGDLSDIFLVPMRVIGSIYARPMSTAQTPCDTPMRPPNVSSSVPAASSTSPNFDMVPVNGQPLSGVNVGRHGNNDTKGARAKRRQLLPPSASDDQPLQDMVITVKRSSSSSSDDDQTTGRPTVSNLSELTVIMSAMDDTVERFLSESQASARIKRFLRDVADDTFAKLRQVSEASHSINKLNKRLNASDSELRRKRKKLLQLQQEHIRLEVEVAAAKKATSSGTAVERSDIEKINDFLLKLSRLT